MLFCTIAFAISLKVLDKQIELWYNTTKNTIRMLFANVRNLRKQIRYISPSVFVQRAFYLLDNRPQLWYNEPIILIVSCFPDAFISENTIFIANRKSGVKRMHLTLNVLISLLIQAKRTGKGKIGNGRMLIMLLQVIADSMHPELSAERNMLRIFSDEPVKSKAYQKIDKQLVKFIPTGKPYPYEKIRFTKFEQSIGDLQTYSRYLLQMHQYCLDLLDPDKTESLIFTILELMRTDTALSDILYGAQYIPKAMLFGKPAHPKKICPSALLLGLLYQMHQSSVVNDESITLMKAPYLRQFHLVYPSGSYRNRTEALKELLNLDAPVTLEQSISGTSAKLKTPIDSEEFHPLDLRDKKGNNAEIHDHGQLFLYGQGGCGKTTLLYRIKTDNICFILPLFKYKPCEISAFQPDISNWILLQILLKYHYQYSYLTYEACTAEEGTDIVLRQLHELKKLLAAQPVNRQSYTLMLDGLNEATPIYQQDLFDEMERISKEWHNVRLIVTGRTVPPIPSFQCYQQIEVCGISEDALDSLLPEKTVQRNLLKTPLFLNIYRAANQNGISLNRACIIDAYINRLIDGVQNKSVQPLLRFLCLYVLPIASNLSAQRQRMYIERGDLTDAIGRAIDIFINDEHIYQNLMYPQKITKKSLPLGSDKDELIDFLVSQICLIQADSADQKMLCFSHQYFRDYFAAKHIVNLLTALHTGYHNVPEQLSELFRKYGLGHLWYPEEMKDIYGLIGELVGDDKNQADEDFIYRETILDTVLDWSRQFDTFRVTENIIRTMAAVRNNMICGVNFSGTALPMYIPCNLKFSLNGEYPCSFIQSQVYLIGLIDGYLCCSAKSPDDTKILLALEDQYALLLDAESKAVLHEFDFSDENSPWTDFDTVVFSQDSQYCAIVMNGNAMRINVQTGDIIRTEKPLSDYGITLPVEIPYTEKQPIATLGVGFLEKLYRNLPHFLGCDFMDAVFLMEETKLFLLDFGAEFHPEYEL